MKVAIYGQNAESKSRLREVLRQFKDVEIIEGPPPEGFQGIRADCVFFDELGEV